MSLHQRAIVQILLAISLLLNHYEVEAEQRLSKAKDLELEKQLKLLNKPAIKTIKVQSLFVLCRFYKLYMSLVIIFCYKNEIMSFACCE